MTNSPFGWSELEGREPEGWEAGPGSPPVYVERPPSGGRSFRCRYSADSGATCHERQELRRSRCTRLRYVVSPFTAMTAQAAFTDALVSRDLAR